MHARPLARWRSLASLAAMAATGACSLVLGLPDQSALQTTDAAAPAQDAPGVLEDGGRLEDVASEAAPTCTDDLETDGEHCGRCGRSCRGGACVGGRCEPMKLTGAPAPTALALTQTHVYFIESSQNVVQRVPKAGGAVETMTTGTTLNTLLPAIAVDDARIVWASDTTTFARAYSCPRDGCGGALTVLVDDEPDLSAIAYDNGHFYGSVITLAPTVGHVIDQPVGGGTRVTLTDAGASELISVKGGLFARVQGSSVYAAAPMQGATDRYLGAVFGDPTGLTTDGTTVAWSERFADGGGTIWVAADAEAAKVMGRGHRPSAVLLDGATIYWTNEGDGNAPGGAFGCPIAGCPATGPIALTVELARPTALAVDDEWIYVAVLGIAPSGPGSIIRVSKL